MASAKETIVNIKQQSGYEKLNFDKEGNTVFFPCAQSNFSGLSISALSIIGFEYVIRGFCSFSTLGGNFFSFLTEPSEMQSWLESHRVSEVTCERLKSEMILTLSDLRGMNDKNIADLNLVMGEQIRLKLAIRKLHDKEQGS